MTELKCRLCACSTKQEEMEKLFRRQNREWLRKIEDLTGLKLQDVPTLPANICLNCKRDLDEAHQFRQRCLTAQEYFSSEQFHQLLKDRDVLTENLYSEEEFKPSLHVLDHNILPQLDSQAISAVSEDYSTNVGVISEPYVKIEEEEDILKLPHSNKKSQKSLKLYNRKTRTRYRSTLENQKGRKSKITPASTVIEDNCLSVSGDFERLSGQDCEEPNNEKEENPQHATKSKKMHLQTKKQEKNNGVLICDQCGNHFTCRHHFLIHLRRHIGDKRYQCEICETKFCTHSELNRHMRRHTGEKPFECKFCKRRFTDFSSRTKHERTHTNERPFSCSHCKKSFTTSYVLKNHILTHTGERPFKCVLCNKSFQRQTHLTTHNRSLMHKDKEHKLLQTQQEKV